MKHTVSHPHVPEKRGFRPLAARLLIAGEICTLAFLCLFAAVFYERVSAGGQGVMLALEDFWGNLSGASLLLWGSALAMDYAERRAEQATGS